MAVFGIEAHILHPREPTLRRKPPGDCSQQGTHSVPPVFVALLSSGLVDAEMQVDVCFVISWRRCGLLPQVRGTTPAAVTFPSSVVLPSSGTIHQSTIFVLKSSDILLCSFLMMISRNHPIAGRANIQWRPEQDADEGSLRCRVEGCTWTHRGNVTAAAHHRKKYHPRLKLHVFTPLGDREPVLLQPAEVEKLKKRQEAARKKRSREKRNTEVRPK